ncbi:MAG TPA: carbon storage regulator [Pirellulaceae bacterium]
MLVLTRRLEQEITIGDAITIRILGVRGKSVRLGIEAPSSIRILRGELESHALAPPDRSETVDIEQLGQIRTEPPSNMGQCPIHQPVLVAANPMRKPRPRRNRQLAGIPPRSNALSQPLTRRRISIESQ